MDCCILNIPALVVIVLSYIWFGLTETAAIGAVALNKLPNVIITIREGARSLSQEFEDLAAVFNFSMMNRLRHIIIPQLGPYIAATMRTGLSLVWKLVLIVELLGRSNGIGFQINLAFQLFDMRLLLAYALPFIAFMLIIETFLVRPLSNAYRDGAAMTLDVSIDAKNFVSDNNRSKRVLNKIHFRLADGEVGAILVPLAAAKQP